MRSSEVRKKWKREKIENYTRRSQEEKQPMEQGSPGRVPGATKDCIKNKKGV